ncbi:MAG: hypothetical protein H8E84_03785 [Flavobacteriales bacterium]|nr:hypothetical protein [Flavobacteriales bacterium]
MKKLYYFINSFFFFVRNVFIKNTYQIIFYAPSHFNRTEGAENPFFNGLLEICNDCNISYLYFEEPDIYTNQKRSSSAIPFDFIYYLIIFLRKFMGSEMSFVEKDKKIGRFLKKIFFRKLSFENYITISQSMLSFFNGVDSNAKLFDLQHGTIHADKENYLVDGKVAENLKENNSHLLLSGNAYKELLTKNENGNYFQNHIEVIGTSTFAEVKEKSVKINKNVLVSLQFTHDHSDIENQQIADSLEQLIKKEDTFHFYLRNHPRFNNEIDLNRFLSLPNVSLISGKLQENFSKCSLHLTSYSTTAFEAALQGIPSCFLPIKSKKFDIFNSQYSYPFYNLSLTELHTNYPDFYNQVKSWANNFYQPLNENNFLASLQNAKQED